MESPVRICLGAILVVYLLLLSSKNVQGIAIPAETTTTLRDDRNTRLSRVNNTAWVIRNKSKTPDVAANELRPKDSVSEEHTEKNAKYKDRGRVKYLMGLTSTTEGPTRKTRLARSESPGLVIVTPTPEVKKPPQIIDSMKEFKKTKLPSTVSTSTMSTKTETKSEEAEEYEEEEEDDKTYEKYTSSKFHDSNFFTIPSFDVDDKFNSKLKHDYSSTPFESSYSSYFPHEDSFSSKDDDDGPYKSDFFKFDDDLTTPKNDFFDKKYEQISKSIIKNLDSIKNKAPPPNATQKIIKENVDLEKLSKGVPTNKSTVIIKNTKEIRLMNDNEGAGTDNKQLSDVQGTSIYYEMSVLSTETYAINHTNDDDCDNDTTPVEPTVSTSSDEELASIKSTPAASSVIAQTTQPTKTESISTASSTYIHFPNAIFSTFSPISLQNQQSSVGISSTEKPSRIITISNNLSSSRSRNYAKRLNFTGTRDFSNSVSPKPSISILSNPTPRNTVATSYQNFRPPTRKFHHTTQRIKPIWMTPKRNVTRVYARPTYPTTIYSEHFSMKDRITTPRTRQQNKAALTTVSSDIDPVLQGEVSGAKKVVQTQHISDNSIPSLWKRGSTKFSSTSTIASAEVESSLGDLEIPTTLGLLASLGSRPSLVSPPANETSSTQKSVDENELQKVGEQGDKKETIVAASVITTALPTLKSDFVAKKINEIDQNKLSWKPISPNNKLRVKNINENKSEVLPVASNIGIPSSSERPDTTAEPPKPKQTETSTLSSETEETESWVPVTSFTGKTTTNSQYEEEEEEEESTETETEASVETTKTTGFESITKFPTGYTTPQDENNNTTIEDTETDANEKVPATTDYEITTIRFMYKPTEETTEQTETDTTTQHTWHPIPTRTKYTTLEDAPITTYRPKYITTTEYIEETTTTVPETTPHIDVSSQILENTKAPESPPTTTETVTETVTEYQTETPTTYTQQTHKYTQTESVTEEPPTSIKIEVVTEINTVRNKDRVITTVVPEIIYTTSEETSIETTEITPTEIHEPASTSEENSGSNEVITQETTKIETPPPTTTTTSTTEATTVKLTTTTTEKVTERITIPEIRTTERITETTKVETTTETMKPTIEVAKEIPDVHADIFATTTEDGGPVDEPEMTTKSTNTLDDLYTEITTISSPVLGGEEAGSGAAVAIAVSTIGVVALILLIGLLLIVRRRGRRGVYAQRCTPMSLDAYSLDSVSVGPRKGDHRLRASKRSYGNPAYDDEVTSHPMQYAALANFALDVESITKEFHEIPSVTVRPDEVPPGCEDKNRYSNVLPLPETRVPLKRIGSDLTTEYINANYITGPGNIRNYYIACQAPLANTVADFWRMMWEQNSRLIVMLTEYMENGVEKCYEYLPPSEISDNRRTFGEFQVILKKREQRDKYAISSVQLINLTTRTWREITHLWYFWPAKGVPEDYDSVIDFLSEMRSYMKVSQAAKEYDEDGVEVIYGDQNRSSFSNLSKFRSDEAAGNGVNVYSPAKAEEQMRRANNGTLGRMKAASEVEGVRACVVVCASGAGRSGALVALDVCARALSAGAADVPRVVRELRAQRPHSLSNRHHYVFLYKVLSEYGRKLMGGVDTI